MASATQQDQVVCLFAKGIRRALSAQARRVILFGSRARGENRRDSDYDLLVIVDRRDRNIEDKIIKVEENVEEQTGTFVAAIVRSEEEWETERDFPFAINIEREGVIL